MARRGRKPLLKTETKRQLTKEVEQALRAATEAEEQIDANMPGVKLDRYGASARKVPYTLKYFETLYPMVTFTPEATVPVTINGVRLQFISGREVTVPEPFKGEYERWRRDIRGFSRPIAVDQGVVSVAPGAGPLPSREAEEASEE